MTIVCDNGLVIDFMQSIYFVWFVLINVTGKLFSLIGLNRKGKVGQAVSYHDLRNEDLCEDETTLYFSHSYLLNIA